MTGKRPHAHATLAPALAATLLLSAPASGAEPAKPPPITAQHYDREAEQRLAGSAEPSIRLGGAVPGDWWQAFRSPKLDAVIGRAIHGNLDLAAADATLAQANEAIAGARGRLRPQVDFGGEAGRQRAVNGAVATGNVYAVGPRVAFDLDVFGGARRLIEEKLALAEVQRQRLAAARLALTGDVASQALQLASARAQIDAVQSLLADDRRTLDLVEAGHRYGGATEVDVAQARAQLAQDQTLLPPLEQQRDTARHALSVLAGDAPDDGPGEGGSAPDFDLADFTLPADLPVSLPSELARRRPDILAAEAELHAARAAVGVATADLYPHVQLTASVLDAGPGIGALWSLAAGLAGPIYRGGTLKANRRAAVDGYDAALAGYRQTVVRALGQVADVLRAIEHDGEEHAAQDHALAAAEANLRLNREGYRAGEVDLLQVLDAERAYQRALLGQIRARTAQDGDAIALAVALGSGGSSGQPAPSDSPRASKTALFSKD